MKHISLDLETLSGGVDACIIQVGAVEFDLDGNLGRSFCYNVDISSALNSGAKVDGDTIYWWMRQSEEAQISVTKGRERQPLGWVLKRFTQFVEACGAEYVWGNGAIFDNRILRESYDRYNFKAPWHFVGDRDMRTLLATVKFLGLRKELEKADIADPEVKHDALHDARYQAEVIYHAHRVMREATHG